MSVAFGKVCLERHCLAGNHSDYDSQLGTCWYIYVPTGKGDYYRYTVGVSGLYLEVAALKSYPFVIDCVRGKVYAGSYKNTSSGDRHSAATTFSEEATDLCTFKHTYFYGATHWIKWAVPTGMTHVRLWRNPVSSYTGFTLKFYNSGNSLMTGQDVTIAQSSINTTCVEPSLWVAIPTGASYVAAYGGSGTNSVSGVQFINKNSEVEPDTIESAMFDYRSASNPSTALQDQADVTKILSGEAWGHAGIRTPACNSLLRWSTSAGGTKVIIGGEHLGITKNATALALLIQDGPSTLAAPDFTSGNRPVVDLVHFDLVDGKACYDTNGSAATQKGVYNGSIDIDYLGPRVWEKYVPNTTMYVGTHYSGVVSIAPGNFTKVRFDGESSARSAYLANATSTYKSRSMTVYGGRAQTVIKASGWQRGTSGKAVGDNSFGQAGIIVGESAYPQISYADPVQKMYIKSFDVGEAEGEEVASGTVFESQLDLCIVDKSRSGSGGFPGVIDFTW